MSDKTKIADHITALQALTQLRDHPGWAIICDKFQERLSRMEEKRDDLNTPAEEAEAIRQTRARLLQDFAPVKLLNGLMDIHRFGANRVMEKQIPMSPQG